MAEPSPTISLKTLNRIARIAEFKGRWESLGQLVPNRLKALQRIANMESAAAAARMKGILCSDRQIGEFLSSRNPQNCSSREKQIVNNGFHRVLKLVNESYEYVNNLIEESRLHPLLILSDFSCRFWHMRPFRQGNNRLTWLLTNSYCCAMATAFCPTAQLSVL